MRDILLNTFVFNKINPELKTMFFMVLNDKPLTLPMPGL